jgi:hypothetical protein
MQKLVAVAKGEVEEGLVTANRTYTTLNEPAAFARGHHIPIKQ